MKKKARGAYWLLLIIAIAFVVLLQQYEFMASGNDAWGHLFKSNLLYENLKEGNIYPLYTSRWYNGVQPFRYWAPLPYYILAVLQFVAGGDISIAYYMFGGVSLFFGACGWMLFGKALNRPGFAMFLGVMWFFLPENIRVFFCEGNIPRMVTAIIIPYLVYYIWEFFTNKKDKAMFPIIICMMGITLSHVMIAAMVGIATFLFLLFSVLSNRQYKRGIQAILIMLVSFAICGIWLLPALSGGLVGMDPEASASVMESLTYPLSESLNPLNRITGIIDTFYYGISIVIISILAIVLGKKGKKAGYYTAVLIVILTTSEVVPILSKIPLSQLLWMMRFATIAYAFFYLALLEWTSVKKGFLILLMLLLIVDCIPSFNLNRYYTQMSGKAEDEIAIAKSITNQRVALLDMSAYGSYPSWEFANGPHSVDYSYGWAWQGAATSSNIVMINTAVELGRYEYVFDRCLELGNDTIVLPIVEVEKTNTPEYKVIRAAAKSEYLLYKKTDKAYIFHRDTPKQFGVSTEYRGLAIGKNAQMIVVAYPEFQLSDRVYLDEYSLDELKKYDVLYLSGFLYRDKSKSEELIEQLSKVGTKVVIDMTYIPEDPITKRNSLLGVTSQAITFTGKFPELVYNGNGYEMDYFDNENKRWRCSFLDGGQNTIGTAEFMNQTIPFLVTKEEGNVVFMGFNLLYHTLLTDDTQGYRILDDVFQMKTGTVPGRIVIPIQVTYNNNEIKIVSQEVPLNTTIAYQDNFISEEGIVSDNNQLIITNQDTTIRIKYPHLWIGLCMSALGIILSIILYRWIKHPRRK